MTSIRRFHILCMLCLGILFLAQTLANASDQDQITKADQLIIEKEYNEALAVLNPLISSPEPTAYDAKGALERCYRASKQWDKAISLIESCIKEYPDNKTVWQTRLGRCYLEMGDNTKAITAFKDGLDSTKGAPGIAQVLSDFLWQCYADKNDWDTAISYYQSLLEKYPQGATEWHYQLGRCYWSTGKSTEAIAEYEKAMELVKDADTAKRIEPVLSSAYLGMGEFGKAEALLKKLEQEYPSCSGYWTSCQAAILLHRGSNLQGKGKFTNAISFFQELINRFANIPECNDLVESAYVCIVESLIGLDKTDQAAAYAKKFYDEQPQMRGAALAVRGLTNYYLKNYDDAITAFQQVISDYPSNMHAQIAQTYLVAALKKAGRTDEAVEMLRASLSMESNPANKAASLLQMANAYYEARKYYEAIEVFKEISEIKDAPDEMKAEATFFTGMCHHAIKFYDSAKKYMDKVIELYPNSQWTNIAKGIISEWDKNRSNEQVEY